MKVSKCSEKVNKVVEDKSVSYAQMMSKEGIYREDLAADTNAIRFVVIRNATEAICILVYSSGDYVEALSTTSWAMSRFIKTDETLCMEIIRKAV